MTDEWFFGEEEDSTDDEADVDIIDINRDKETGELLSFLVFEDGEYIPKKATATNVLLYLHGLKEFLSGQHAVIVSEHDPELIIAPTGNDMAYLLKVNGSTVETTPSQATEVLEGLRDVVEASSSLERSQGIETIVGVYDTIISEQVRRWLVRALRQTFDKQERQRISQHDRGWLVDGYYLIDWNANLYTINDDPDEADYQARGNTAQTADKDFQFLKMTPQESPEARECTINGESYRISEREMLFLAKVRFMLDRRHYHEDIPFWKWNDNYANLDQPDDSDGSGGLGLNL